MMKICLTMFFMSYEIYKIICSDLEIRNRELAKDYNKIKSLSKRNEYKKLYLDQDFLLYNLINTIYWFFSFYLLFSGEFASLGLMILPYFINKIHNKYLAIKIDSIISIFILFICNL